MKNPKKENRRLRFVLLLETVFRNRQVDLADRIGITANLVSRYVKGVKGIGEDMRDRIEQACGLEPGWLDIPYALELEVVREREEDHAKPPVLLLSFNSAPQHADAESSVSPDGIFFDDSIRERFSRLTTEGRIHARARLLAGIDEAERMYPSQQQNAS